MEFMTFEDGMKKKILSTENQISEAKRHTTQSDKSR